MLMGLFKNMDGNIPSRNFLGGDFVGGNFQGRSYMLFKMVLLIMASLGKFYELIFFFTG